MPRSTKKYWSHKVVNTKGSADRIADYCAAAFPILGSRSAAKKAILNGRLRLNGNIASTTDLVRKGDLLELQGSGVRKVKTLQIDLDIIFEDDSLVVVNKSGGIAVNGNRKTTLENALARANRQNKLPDALPRPLAVHRIDVPTSGLVLFAKTKSALIELGKAFQQNRVTKEYIAVVHGKPAQHGRINLPIQGKKAETSYERLEVVPSRIFQHLSLVLLKPVTGRTHQLRIHMKKEGHLIVGDKQYADTAKTILGKGMLLCAKKLVFAHPVTGKDLRLEIDTPTKFKKVMQRERDRFVKQ